MLTVIIFVIVLGVLVLVHEFGHFITAKKAGMKVEEFGFGFPPALFKYKKGETSYSINLIPFGGFVKILGEDGQDRDNPRSFSSKSIGKRVQVIIAGVVMNVLLGFFLFFIANTAGLRIGIVEEDTRNVSDIKIQITQISDSSPAQDAGLQPLDQIIGFSEKSKVINITQVEEVQSYINTHRGQSIDMIIRHGNQELTKSVVPRVEPPPGQGVLGIGLAMTGVVKYPWYEALYQGAQNTLVILTQTVYGYFNLIKNLLVHGSPGIDLSGPIGIATVTGQAARIGFVYLLQFTAIISVNLAILNIIPFPALDGGRLLFLIIEAIKRSPVSKRIEGTVNTVGFALLILLMVYVTTRDIARFF